MHGSVCYHRKCGCEYSQTNRVHPHRLYIETEVAEDGAAWHMNVQAILLLRQRQVLDLIDNESLKPKVEY